MASDNVKTGFRLPSEVKEFNMAATKTTATTTTSKKCLPSITR